MYRVRSAHTDQLNAVVRRPGALVCLSPSIHTARGGLYWARSTPSHGGEVLLAPGKEQEQAATMGFIKPGYRLLLKPGKKLAADELQARESL